VSAPANLQPDDDIQGTTVNWVGEEPRLACCVCDNYQQAINTRDAPRFLLQPTQYSPVCGHTGSQCCDEGDRSNWADCCFHGTRVGHTGPGYPSNPGINIPILYRYCFNHKGRNSPHAHGKLVHCCSHLNKSLHLLICTF